MFKQVWAMTRKELMLWMQRPTQWAIIFLTPFVFVAIMGQVFKGGGAPTVAVYAVNEDDGRAGRQIMELLADEKTLDMEVLESRAEADRRIGQGQRMAAIVVPAGFSDALVTPEGAKVEIIVDPARQETAGIVVGQVNASLVSLRIDAEVTRGVSGALDSASDNFTVSEQEAADTGIDMEAVRKFLTAALKGVVSSQVQDALEDPQIVVERRPAGDVGQIVQPPTIIEYLVPGYTFFFVFYLIGMMAQVVLNERVTGTFRRLLATPASRAAILLGKIVPYFLIAAVQIVGVIGLCSLIFDVSLGHSPAAFVLMVLASSAAVVGLGIMVAALVRTEGQAGSLPDLLTIAMAVVSGAMFPSIRLPFLEYLTPHYWAIQGFQDVMSRDLGPAAIYPEAAILAGMALLFFVVGVSRFRFE